MLRKQIYCFSNYRTLQEQNQFIYDDVSFNFIRNVTQIIECKYSSTNKILQIDSSSCRLAGTLLCTHLLKMLFALYDTESVFEPEEKTMNIQTISSKLFILLF